MADSTATVTLPAQIVFLDNVLNDSRVYLTAIVAVYFWEYIVTFPMEYSRMWKAERWTFVRAAFFFNRYWGLGLAVLFMITFWSEIPSATCKKIHFIQPVWALLLIWSNEFLLGARVYAIWNQNRMIAYGLATLSTVGVAVKIFIFVQDEPLPIPDGFGLKGCISNGGVSYIWLHWAIPLFYDAVVFALTLIPLFKYYKTGGSTPLLEAFFRDGALFFFVSAAVNGVNVVYFVIPGVTNNAFNTPLALLVAPMMAARVVLNLRAPQIKMHNSSSHVGVPSSLFRTTVRGPGETGVGSQKAYPLSNVQTQPTHVAQHSLSQSGGVMVNIEKNVETVDNDDYYQKQWKHDGTP
ncbi:hypothetical protein BT69DRAFT_1284883 [Atractiella rhizophila]|nr:hypothetical protein BT69DRAFT_1284883 [Atractiella rhizophila]